MNGHITHIKRYHIAKVYRRDQPAIARGRLREFYQCDFDIAGVYDPMISDAEILRVIVEVFEALQINVTIKVNHRSILDGLFLVTGVPNEKLRSISSAIDKLDKSPWTDVRKEMVEEKGLPEEIADQIGEYVRRSGDIFEILEFLKSDPKLATNEGVKKGLDDMGLLASYLNALDVHDKVSFDLSLARGLDYYSGLIYEVVTKEPDSGAEGPSTARSGKQSKKANQASQVGSIAAGGRYDGLVGMYGKRPIPCVGISFGVDRIFTILEKRRKDKASPTREIDVYVMAIGDRDFDGLLLKRMEIARILWNAGIRAEFAAKVKPKTLQQFKAAKGVPLTVILGQEELAAGQVRLKVFKAEKDEANEKDRGQLVSLSKLVEEVRRLL